MMKRYRRPLQAPALEPGDRVHIVSPAGPVVPELLEEGIDRLRQWDLEVIVDEAVYQRRPPYDYLAGDDQARLQAFVDAWSDPKCRAIICSRGGYGAMRLLPQLDINALISQPRLLVGFSDITALHLYVAGIGGLATLHGPVLKSLCRHDDDPHRSADRLRQALFATSERPAPWTGLRTICNGAATGPVFGGNLSLLVALLATPYAPSLDGAIVVVEDVGEDDYRVDRLLTALRLSQNTAIAGLVLGDFSDCDGVYVADDDIDEFLAHLGAEFDCPVVAGAPVGHGGRNVPFPIGVDAELDATAGTLSFHHHAATRSAELLSTEPLLAE